MHGIGAAALCGFVIWLCQVGINRSNDKPKRDPWKKRK